MMMMMMACFAMLSSLPLWTLEWLPDGSRCGSPPSSQSDGWMDGWMDGWVDRRSKGRTDGWFVGGVGGYGIMDDCDAKQPPQPSFMSFAFSDSIQSE